MLAPNSATGLLSVLSRDTGVNELTWVKSDKSRVITLTYHPYLKKADMIDQGRSHLLEIWKKLDNCIDIIRTNESNSAVTNDYKIMARTYADVIQQLMPQFYSEVNAVLVESMNRWRARQDSREYESPGLAESIWDPSTRFDGTPFSKEAEKRARSGGAQTQAGPKLDEKKIAFIRHSLEMGALDANALAKMFNVSPETIAECVEK